MRYSRPVRMFSFYQRDVGRLESTQRSILRRANYKGTTFNDGSGAAAPDQQEVTLGDDTIVMEQAPRPEIKEVELDWETLEEYEFDGPTYLTLTLPDQALLCFKVTDEHHFEFYSNTRNLVDVVGKLEKE